MGRPFRTVFVCCFILCVARLHQILIRLNLTHYTAKDEIIEMSSLCEFIKVNLAERIK